jgi:hypothetical protein
VKWALLRMMWWMKSIRSAENDGNSHRKIGSKNQPVCCAENESVDITKIKQAQSSAGHQVRSQAGTGNPPRRGCMPGSWVAGRGLRQGCSDTDRTLREKPQGSEVSAPRYSLPISILACVLADCSCGKMIVAIATPPSRYRVSPPCSAGRSPRSLRPFPPTHTETGKNLRRRQSTRCDSWELRE